MIAILILATLICSLSSIAVKADSDLEINIFLPAAVNNPGALSSFGQTLGVKFSSAKFYLDWSDDFESGIAHGFSDQGAIPELTWQPQTGDSSCSNGGVVFSEVLSGRYDGYIDQFARDVVSFGSSIRINLAPEVNGIWEPWAVGNCGNTSSSFQDFYRYVVNKFHAQGTTNVDWIFAPNIHHWGETASYAELFPGDNYVDYVGLDGYNWGTSRSWSTWQSFSEIFGSSYSDIISLTSKDVIITEFASTELGGSKAQWISDMFRDVRNSFTRIKGITWFNIDKETDWRIESSESSKEAFIRGIRGEETTIARTEVNPNSQQGSPVQDESQSYQVDEGQQQEVTPRNPSEETHPKNAYSAIAKVADVKLPSEVKSASVTLEKAVKPMDQTKEFILSRKMLLLLLITYDLLIAFLIVLLVRKMQSRFYFFEKLRDLGTRRYFLDGIFVTRG